MLKKLLLVLVAVLIAFGVFVQFQPEDFTIERSATVNAPVEQVFVQVADFHRWAAWSPWAKLDPNAKNSFEGPESGVGMIFKWSGNDELGEGMMTLVESRPNELVKIKLDFVRPMEDTSLTQFTLEPAGNSTRVVWSMSGRRKNFFAKAMCLLMGVDKIVGSQFEQGLANIKNVVEPKPAN